VTALVVMAGAALVATGGLLASNMGFKLNFPVKKAGVGVSKSGRQAIGLPYNRQVGIDFASDLFTDVAAAGVSPVGIERFDAPTDTNALYNTSVPAGSAGDFGLLKGQGYLLQVGTTGNYIIVGSHDPAFAVPFKKAAVGVSKTGRLRYAHPYHGVSAFASELFTELSPDAVGIERFDAPTDTNALYNTSVPAGSAGDFALVPGSSYLVQVSADKNFIPSHY
jgi:hypothetical protein